MRWAANRGRLELNRGLELGGGWAVEARAAFRTGLEGRVWDGDGLEVGPVVEDSRGMA